MNFLLSFRFNSTVANVGFAWETTFAPNASFLMMT